MRTNGATGPLIALLNGTADFVMARLFTITLSVGTVIRWTDAAKPITFSGNTWTVGPVIRRGKISHKLGVEVSTLDVHIDASLTDQINGAALIPFIVGNGLDGATFMLQRAFMADWASAPVGALIDFSGRVTSIKSISRSELDLTVSAWTVLLNVNMPPDLYQASCNNTVFDTNCTLNKASFASSGTVSGSPTTNVFNTNRTQADGYFDQGQITFTSGPNNGVTRAIKSYLNASGQITLALPLPVAPAAGNTFTAYPGCDRTMATCAAKFSNLLHFRGEPFIPVVETAV